MTNTITNKEIVIIFLLLGLTIIGFNFPEIFLSKVLYLDDNHRLVLGLENKIHATIFNRNPLRAYVIFPLYKLLSINIIYARLAQTLVFYIPLALVFYILIRNIS